MLQQVEYNDLGIPIKLKLLEIISDYYGIKNNEPLHNFALVAIQHLQGSTVPLIHSLMSAGISPDKIFLVGKAYSTHPSVISHLQQLGCWVADNHKMNSVGNPYDLELEAQIDVALELTSELIHKKPETSVLLLDEAGRAIRILHNKYSRYTNKFKCVEQTSRGINEIAQIELQCPVVNVARSKVKKEVEATLIASQMVVGIDNIVERWQRISQVTAKKFLVIGYGVIGSSLVKQLLAQNYQVAVYDNKVDWHDKFFPTEVEIVTQFEENLSRFSVILSCTGTQGFPLLIFEKLKEKCLLVNCGSSDIEFSAWKLRPSSTIKYTRGNSSLNQAQLQPWLNLYQVNYKKNSVYLANGGFPINFTGELDPIPPEKFQLTRALMLLGSFQSVASTQKGIIPLDEFGQELILKELIH